jgi:hypothetical protein
VIRWVFWGAPDTRSAKFTTSAFFVVVWAIHLTPGMRPTVNNTPAMILRVINSLSNFLFWMSHGSVRMGIVTMLSFSMMIVK